MSGSREECPYSAWCRSLGVAPIDSPAPMDSINPLALSIEPVPAPLSPIRSPPQVDVNMTSPPQSSAQVGWGEQAAPQVEGPREDDAAAAFLVRAMATEDALGQATGPATEPGKYTGLGQIIAKLSPLILPYNE